MSWDVLNNALAEARTAIAAQSPDPAVAAEGEAYLLRVLAAGLGGAVLGHLFRQDGLSRALHCYGGPNPDYIMRFAPVSTAGHYRLTGQLNGSERVGVGLYSYGPNGAPLAAGYAAFDASNCDADGRFSLAIDGGEGGSGLQIRPGTQVMLVRVLHRDLEREPASLRFTGAPPQYGLALATGTADGALEFVARSLAQNVREYLKWTAAARDLANRLDLAPPELTETVQGDPDTQYYLGGFDLGPDEWLEVTMPPALPGYWSLHAYNFWYEQLQIPGAHDRNAQPDPDGRVRIAVGPLLPDTAANAIDTLGRTRGAFVCRMIGGGAKPETVVRRLTD